MFNEFKTAYRDLKLNDTMQVKFSLRSIKQVKFYVKSKNSNI